MVAPRGGEPESPRLITTHHVRRAALGHAGSLEWVVRRVTPLVRAQALYRLGRHPNLHQVVEDVVSEAWLAALSRLSELRARKDRLTPVLLSFLTTTVRNLVNDRLRDAARSQRVAGPLPDDTSRSTEGRLPSPLRDAMGRIEAAEAAKAIAAAIQDLDPESREVLILRGIEGLSNQDAAAELGESPNTLAQRYLRAIRKVRDALPSSVFDEFPES